MKDWKVKVARSNFEAVYSHPSWESAYENALHQVTLGFKVKIVCPMGGREDGEIANDIEVSEVECTHLWQRESIQVVKNHQSYDFAQSYVYVVYICKYCEDWTYKESKYISKVVI